MSRLWITPEELEDVSSSPFAYEACKVASFVLWAFSGRKYAGTRTVTERYETPCRSALNARLAREPGLFSVEPYLTNGQFTNACSCSGTIAGRHVRLRLRGHPVKAVQKVMSGSTEITADKYQIVNSGVLQAAPGASFDMTDVEVTYTYGVEPPTAGRRAARHLAQQLAKGWAGDDDCQLPDRVTSVSRQGVSYTILDDQAFLDELRTGIYSVDLFLRAVNPDRARKPARVFSPDVPRGTRVTVNRPQVIGPYDFAIVPGEPATWSVDLNEVNGTILLDADWAPQAQISSWNGALLLEFTPDRFEIVDGTLTVSLTATETSRISIGGSGAWDLYALNQTDGYTIIHIMNSNVQLVGQSLTAPIL